MEWGPVDLQWRSPNLNKALDLNQTTLSSPQTNPVAFVPEA